MSLRKIEGAGKAGRSTAPVASRANEKSTRASHHRYAETIRPSLREWFTAYGRALLGVHDLLVTVVREMRDAHRRELGTSQGVPGPHVFAVRIGAVRQEHVRVHRIPRPTSVTIAKRPSRGVRDVQTIRHFVILENRNIFAAGAGQDFCKTACRANQSV